MVLDADGVIQRPRLVFSCTLIAGLLAGTSFAVADTLQSGHLGTAPVGRQADRPTAR